MSPPWMPLYIGDYLADTAHLRAAEHGAYLLLIMHYWRTGGLPQDDLALARIARMGKSEWAKARPVLCELFSDGWKHKRIEFELTEAARLSAAGRKGGQASGAARRSKSQRSLNEGERPLENRSNDHGNDPATIREALHSPSPKKDAAGAAPELPLPDEEVELFKRGKQVLGNGSGGLIAKLLKAKSGKIPLARAAIETAATKSDPREYVGAITRGAVASQNDWESAIL